MSYVKLKNIQVGFDANANNNFTWYQPATPDGSVRLGLGNWGTIIQDVLTVNNQGFVKPKYLQLENGLAGSSVAGGLEYDGGAFYGSAVAGQRALVPSEYYYRNNATATIANIAGLSAWLGVGVTLQAGKTYHFVGAFRMSRAAGAVSHTVTLGFGGTATLSDISYIAQSSTTTGDVIGAVSTKQIASAAATPVTAASTVATENNVISIEGTVRVNAGGTFIPQAGFSAAPGGAATVAIGAWFSIKAVGDAAANINIGNWA